MKLQLYAICAEVNLGCFGEDNDDRENLRGYWGQADGGEGVVSALPCRGGGLKDGVKGTRRGRQTVVT